METLLQDIRYAFRLELKKPGLALVALLTLGLGIGANTAIFSIFNAVLLRPLAFNDPDRLMTVWETNLRKGYDRFSVSIPNFLDWKNENGVFEQMAAYRTQAMSLTGNGEAERPKAAVVSPELFPLLGVQPAYGRSFKDEESKVDKGHVAILSYNFFQRRYGALATSIGRDIELDGELYTIIGVMPADFQFPIEPVATELWIPLTYDDMQRGSHQHKVVARLKNGVTIERAQLGMTAIAQGLEQQYPASNTEWGARIIPLRERVVGDVRLPLLLLQIAVMLVLLIVCANLANLLLTRAVSREKEMAIRMALGASRRRLIRQLLTESLLLAVAGGALGLFLTALILQKIIELAPRDIPRLNQISIDGSVLAFTLVVSLLTVLISGLAPSIHSSKTDLSNNLKEGISRMSASPHRNLMRQVFIVIELAFSLILLLGAGLMIKSFLRLQEVSPGFDPNKLYTTQIILPEFRYDEPSRQKAFLQEALRRAQAVPGVESVGGITTLPFGGSDLVFGFAIEGKPQSTETKPTGGFRAISPGYFSTMGIPLLSGRDFSDRDADGSPEVVIINKTMADRFWPGEDPIGKRITIGYGKPVLRQIVGIAGDVKHSGLDVDAKAEMYLPYLQTPLPFVVIVARVNNAIPSLANSIRSTFQSIDESLPVYATKPMAALISDSIAQPRFRTRLLVGFAALAFSLAMVGLYSVMSYSVSQRTHELGIRMAMGAQPGDILKLLLKQGMSVTMIGVGLGLAGAFLLLRVMSTLLYGISPTDTVIFITVTLCVIFVAALAIYLPVRKALSLDPMIALRF